MYEKKGRKVKIEPNVFGKFVGMKNAITYNYRDNNALLHISEVVFLEMHLLIEERSHSLR